MPLIWMALTLLSARLSKEWINRIFCHYSCPFWLKYSKADKRQFVLRWPSLYAKSGIRLHTPGPDARDPPPQTRNQKNPDFDFPDETRSEREGFAEPELGFIIGVGWQRRGYGEEVCRAIMKYGLQGGSKTLILSPDSPIAQIFYNK